jgi:transcriptional regulator with AAA-type ATPase domain
MKSIEFMTGKTVHFGAGEQQRTEMGLQEDEEGFRLAFEKAPVRGEVRPEHGFRQIIGKSKALKQVLQQAQHAAPPFLPLEHLPDSDATPAGAQRRHPAANPLLRRASQSAPQQAH